MNSFLDWARALSPPAAAGWLFAANAGTMAVALLAGYLASALWFAGRRVTPPPDPLSAREVGYAAAGLVVNWAVTVVAWFLWREGIVVLRRDTGWRAWLDAPLLVLVMDGAMYVLHRVVHWRWFYPIHRLHHEYDRPRPLSLFVLHPLETLAFGVLWILVITAHAWSWLGLSVYLAVNLGMGMLGHLGVEPLPAWFDRVPLLRQLGTSTFHAQHHQDVHHNFGFYTLVWDRLFGTLLPGYDARFGRAWDAPGGAAAVPDSTEPIPGRTTA
jgi:sterol desaturase/sphingolipid hydroxylase (fatty acid hydroxylase superfamily)